MKALIIAIALLASGCSHLLYYPTQHQHYDPKKFKLNPKDVWFKSEKGDDLHAWYFESKQKPSKGTIVFFHGNAQNLSSHFANLIWLPEQGYSYFIFDYPGFGQSPGKPNPENTVLAGKAAIRWVYENLDKRPIVLGSSLGGAIAQRAVLDLKNEIPFRALVLDSTFNSYQSIARKKLSSSWVTWAFQPFVYVLLSDRWTADEDDLKKLSPIPVLVVHGDQDTIVEPEFGEEIFEYLAQPKEFWKINGGLHTDVFWIRDGEYRTPFLEWLKKTN